MSGVGVLDKAVVILGACVDGASLAELVERTKLPRATAHRLAQALTHAVPPSMWGGGERHA